MQQKYASVLLHDWNTLAIGNKWLLRGWGFCRLLTPFSDLIDLLCMCFGLTVVCVTRYTPLIWKKFLSKPAGYCIPEQC